MKKESTSKQKDNRNFLAAAVSLVLAAALFAMDLYILLNKPTNVLGILGTTALMLIWIYFFVRSVFQEMEKNREETKAYLEALLKSEKAFFLMQRKFEDELHQIEEYSKLPSDQIITAQKAIAKLTINRIRENTDALLDSNDQLLDKIDALQEQIIENENTVKASEENFDESANEINLISNDEKEKKIEELAAKQMEMADSLDRIEYIIKDEIAKAIVSISQLQSGLQDSIRQETNTIADRVSASNAEVFEELKSIEKTHTETSGMNTSQMNPVESQFIEKESELKSDNNETEFFNNETVSQSTDINNDKTETAESFIATAANSQSEVSEEITEPAMNVEKAAAEEPAMNVEEIVAEEPAMNVEQTVAEESAMNVEEAAAEEPAMNVEQTVAEESAMNVQEPAITESTISAEMSSIDHSPVGETEDIPIIGEAAVLEEVPFEEAIVVDTEEPVPELNTVSSYEESKREVDSLLESLQDLDLNIAPEEKTSLNDQISLSEKLSKEEPAAKPKAVTENQRSEVKPAVSNEKPAAKPKAPDLSNPNRMMTPDEIAALLASM